ncbi:phosphate signaling complex protein PhoU [Lutibacter aestuarii]|uniref:Phosphate-specific transport system accessory protein PhoU n=1 Tax=Lutibacter aestuarii TaxID=861111 RepID=A0ABW2Z3Q7_9FLAO|nr:phosphate signaling complex protein PhoU [uncultured Lutibacter sp.]
MVINAEQQRASLNQTGLEMLNLCTSQLEKATEALKNHDSDLAEEVMNGETRVNALDLKIERDCEKFLALYNPVAIDLRFIMAIRKINLDLERMGDIAYEISNYVVDEDKKIPASLFKALSFDKMYETLTSMLEDITVAYEENDVKISRKVFKKGKALNKINAKAFDILEAEIKKDNEIIKQALLLFVVVKKLERVGGLIKNIAEEIIFYIDAEVLKHKKKK